MPGLFALWQPRYAEHNIPTFPVREKRPCVRGYLRIGSATSARFVAKFADADAIGFALGKRSNITVLDVDTPDERVLADALDRHGKSPIIVRSGSGNFQAWYRCNGEKRQVRPEREKPIDILGGGFVVAPPSHGSKSNYQFIQGSLDDLEFLPQLRGLQPKNKRQTDSTAPLVTERIGEGARNATLFNHCMKAARHCDDLDALLDAARTRNNEFVPPLPDDEVVKTCNSVWGYTERGENRFGRHGVWFSTDEANHLIKTDPDKFLLLSFLRANNGPRAAFMIANGLEYTLRMPRKRLAATRRRLEQTHVSRIRNAGRSVGPALYRWKKGGPI